MESNSDNVSHETPPYENLGPILRIDVKKLLNDIETMDGESRDRAMALLKEYVVFLENVRV
jgi:hypothetical protein